MKYPVVELPEVEYRRVWDRFYEDFKFRPSTSSRSGRPFFCSRLKTPAPQGKRVQMTCPTSQVPVLLAN